MRFRILGPLEIAGAPDAAVGPGAAGAPGAGGGAPRAPKLRAVLGTLLVRANEVVSVDGLIDELWPDSPPRTATSTLHVYVSHLRKLLRAADADHGSTTLLTRSPGYLLAARTDEIDATVFTELHEQATVALEEARYARAVELEQRATRLWRGPLLSDTPHGLLLESAATRLGEARLAAVEQRILAELHLGRGAALVSELQALTTEHPLREEFHAQLMLALCRSGQQAEALRVYAQVRHTLVDELGIEPGPRLRRLHRQVLDGDEALLPPGRTTLVEHTPEQGTAAPAAPGEPTAPVPVSLLPAPDPDFTGRADQLAQVEHLLLTAPAGGWVAVLGLPGSGTSAVAALAARRVANAFPHGTVYLDLRPSHGPELGPVEAAAALLRRAGAAPPREPVEELQLLLARRRMLLVLDHAATEEQIRPLLPTTPGSTALVTGRLAPTGPAGMLPVVLGALTRAEARELLAPRTTDNDGADGSDAPTDPTADDDACATDDTRSSDDARATDELTRLCGGLPLALRAVAARLAARPELTRAALAARLRDERSRLALLRVGDLDVRARLHGAYARLDAVEQDGFRLLGLLPRGRFGVGAAAAVLGREPVEASVLAEALVGRHLLAPVGADAYAQHELLRLLARQLLAERDAGPAVRAATARMCTWYAEEAEEAARLPGASVFTPDGPPRRVELVYALRAAHEAGLWRLTVRLADALSTPLERDGAWDDWATAHGLALDAARRAGDRGAQARMLRSMGELAWYQRDLNRAEACYRQAAGLTDDPSEGARILVGQAELLLDTGAVDEAHAVLTPARALLADTAPDRAHFELHRALALTALERGAPQAARAAFATCARVAATLRDPRLESYARRRLRGADDPLDAVEVRPGLWRLRTAPGPARTPAPDGHLLAGAGSDR
ncbi:AfsR/SARP family transcriptional regulator [Streptomyces sp. SP17BM10]|uniref:AfsR/SARP family transcriptional regulator n=1 Tax=Streptomyces sp. SP17BM10 TaxID=3002530 RepID=UPI002E7A0BBB|nr:AfsR/SARP family transcriptional regulator [Streptomyces sp. SP17BM10]MEE1781608.1 AfsR/SARP family transcriptional regulator [Streptomyces sp. SP17BM10]